MKFSRSKKSKVIALTLFSILISFLVFIALKKDHREKAPILKNPKSDSIIIEIKKGDSIIDIAKKLKEKGIIESNFVFIFKAFITGTYNKIKAGEYVFSPHQDINEILNIFREGKFYLHKVTIPEGTTLWQIGEILEKENICKKEEFLSLAENPLMAKKLGLPGPNLEGYLFPDTYFFYKNTPPELVIHTMVKNFWAHWEKFKDIAKKKNKSMKEVIILASIVEKEAFYSHEKPIIAGVYLNRLEKNMPLQADPTINYALKDFRRLTYKDYYSVKSPYNTYLNDNLPPTPICNPGEESIKSVLFPAKVPYLYFVAKEDKTHHFSTTYKEHLKAIEKIRNNNSKENSTLSLISEGKDKEKQNL